MAKETFTRMLYRPAWPAMTLFSQLTWVVRAESGLKPPLYVNSSELWG
jgi:hypothetical protein